MAIKSRDAPRSRIWRRRQVVEAVLVQLQRIVESGKKSHRLLKASVMVITTNDCRSSASNRTTGSSTSNGSKKRLFRKRRLRASTASVAPASSTSTSSKSASTPNLATTSSARPHTRLRTEPREPVFILDVRTQNTRLVTPRQRQEIYALNRVMTRLENERFRQFCAEKGHKGDGFGVEYDMFL